MASNLQQGHRMKLRTALALTLGALLLGFPFATSAQTPATLTAGTGSGLPGANGVSIPITFSANGNDVVIIGFTLSFDGSKIAYSSIQTGPAADDAGKAAQANPSSNSVTIIISGLNATAMGDGDVAYVLFDVLPTATSGTTPLSLSNSSMGDPSPVPQPVPHTLVDGSFTVDAPAVTDTPTNTLTPTLSPTVTQTPTETLTPTQTKTPITPSVTPTGPTRTASRTPTKTITPTRTVSPTVTQTPTITLSPTRTKYVSRTPTGTITVTPDTATPGPTGTLVIGLPTTPTATSEGGNFVDLRGPAGTQTAQAKFDQDIAATATALAGGGTAGQTGGMLADLLDTLVTWALHNATWLVLGGMGLGALLIAVWMGFAIFRDPKAKEKKK